MAKKNVGKISKCFKSLFFNAYGYNDNDDGEKHKKREVQISNEMKFSSPHQKYEFFIMMPEKKDEL